MLVSILTVYYNRGDWVLESLRSLLDQTYSDIEIIAVDDGSTDHTLRMLRSFNDPRLKVIHHSNRGFTRSIIEAVKQSSGEYIAIHGSGDISFPRRIELQADLLNRRPSVGIVGCKVENENKITGVKSIYDKLDESAPPLQQLLKANVYTHGEVMFRRCVYERAGGYRELFKFTQDYDLWLRMALITEFASVREVLYRRFTLPDGVSASLDKLVVQQYLAELGRQCIEARTAGGSDIIDKHGVHSIFFMKRSRRLSRSFFNLAKAALIDNKDRSRAIKIMELSLNEHRPLKGVLFMRLLMLLEKSVTVEKFAFSLFRLLKETKRAARKSHMEQRSS